jgi:hypothetical protein
VLLTQAVRQLAEADILRKNPHATPRELQRDLARRIYGGEVAERLFPEALD